MNGGSFWIDSPSATCWLARALNVVDRWETRPLRSDWRSARSVTRWPELLMLSVSTAWPLGVRLMSDTLPTELPETSTWSPDTIWLAFVKIALTWYFLPPDISSTITATITTPIAPSAATLAITDELRTAAT